MSENNGAPTDDSQVATINQVAGMVTIGPGPHSPQGRLKRLEETMTALLEAMVEGENKQDQSTNIGALGMLAIGSGPTPYVRRLRQLRDEYKSFLTEVYSDPAFNYFHPGTGSQL